MTTIEKNVMATVRVVYAARLLTSPTALKLYVFAVSVCGIATLVSVPHVVANFSMVADGGAGAMAAFALAAVEQTKIIVQIALFAAACAIGSFTVDVVRNARFVEPVRARV